MELAAEDAVLALTGGLFLALALLAPRLGWRLSPLARGVLTVGVAAPLVGALLGVATGVTLWAPLVWSSVALPIVVAAVLAAEQRGRRCQPTPRLAPVSSELAVLRVRAADPTTPPSELADLAYQHRDLRRDIAANPSTPSSVLAWLATSGDTRMLQIIAAREDGPSLGLR